MRKRYDFTVAGTNIVQLKIQMCEPYPPGSATAKALPIVRSYAFLSAPTPTGFPFFEASPGGALLQAAWNQAESKWDVTPAPQATLAASYNQAGGIVTVTIPFGSTYTGANPLSAGAPPTDYSYAVMFNDVAVVDGLISVQPPPPPPPPAPVEACVVTLGGQDDGGAASGQGGGGAASGQGGSGSVTKGPWLAGV